MKLKNKMAGLLLLLAASLHAQDHVSFQVPVTPVNLVGETSFSSAPFTLDVDQNPVITDQNYRVKQAVVFISLSVDDMGLYKMGNALEEAEVIFDFTRNFPLTSLTESNVALTLSANQAKSVYRYDFTDDLVDGMLESFELDDVVLSTPIIASAYSGLSADLIDYVKEHIHLQMWYEIEYGVDVVQVAPGLQPCEPLTLTPKNSAELVNRVQQFEWTSTEGYDFPGYEFQLLKLENNASTDPTVFKCKVDWSKALKVETYSSEPELTLTIAQGSGYYIWRVRPIGTYYEGGIADSRNWGQWSAGSIEDGVELTMNASSYLYIPSSFKFQDPDHEKNWIYSRVFTEEGNVAEGMSYANELLQPVQTQAYSSSTGQVITAQTLYDFTGRPSMSTIPVPSEGQLEGYKDEFVLNNTTSELYTAEDFDSDAAIQNPDKIKQTGTLFSYYSNDNPDEFIPDAQGYPFVRTIFMNDGSGRPIEQSGVGKVHAIGQITEGSTHTTKIYYGTPSDDELIAVFGDEAPMAEKVVKTSTIDPNGTINIVYTTIEGKTIATAMTYNNAPNLSPIDEPCVDSQLDISASFETVVNTMDNNMFISSKILVLPQEETVDLSYYMDCQTLENTCGGPDCDYKIKFRIVNEITGEYFETNDFELTCGSDLVFEEMFWTPNEIDFSLDTEEDLCSIVLEAGYWKIQKVVWSGIDPDAITNNSPIAKLEPLMSIVSGWMQAVTNDDQYTDFMDQLEIFNDAIADAHAAATTACSTNYTDISSCYQSHADFVAIRTLYGLGPFYLFDPEYSIDLPLNGSGQQYISFSAGCCADVHVDIPNLENHVVCHTIDSLLGVDDLTQADVMFSQLFKEFFDELVDEGAFEPGDMGDEWEVALPGYGALTEVVPSSGQYTSDLDQMVFHMLTDQYYIGKGYYDGTDWITFESIAGPPVEIYPVPTPADPALYGPHYSCSELYDCWYASMRAYYELNVMQGQTVNLYDLVNDELDPTGTTDPVGGHYDDPENADAEAGFLDWLVNAIISHKMKKFSDELTGDTSGDNANPNPQFAIQINAANLFLECSGKKIAAIVSPEIADELNYSIYTTDNYAGDPDEIVLATDDEGEELVPDQLTYPYIIKPVWAFKYYEYIPAIDASSIPFTAATCSDANCAYLPPVGTAEITYCYHDFNADDFCSSNPCPYDHHTWSAEERLGFYDAIKYAKEDTDFGTDIIAEPFECPSSGELADMRDAEFDKAYQACHDRRPEFTSGIENMLLQNCYVLVPCNDGSGENYVSQAEIESLTDNVEEACSLYVDAILVECEDGFVPTCDDNSCLYWNGTNFASTTELLIVLFNPAKNTKEKLYYVQQGNFIPALDPADSKCVTAPESPAWYSNAEIDPGCPEEVLTPIVVDSE